MGVPDSGGIWAPSLSYENGTFYLVYTIVRTWGMGRPFKDHHNYLVTSDSIHGPWSEPVFINSSGFDASLFHDDDGRKWMTNIQWDFRKGQSRFGGIILQEYDHAARKVTGPMHNILRKDILIEGPNLYKKDGCYYLMLAEGGTGWNHSISMTRSRSIAGPYECDPQSVVLTARDDMTIALQKAGHGELVQTQSGEWYLAHLCSRSVGKERRCMLGRETAIQKVAWSEDGWLRLAGGGTAPQVDLPAPAGLKAQPWPQEASRDDFDASTLSCHWNSLRVPVDESWLSLHERPGWLRLRGRESLFSIHEQSLLARRLQSFRCTVQTSVEFEPAHFTQSAGKVLGVVLTDDGVYEELLESNIPIAGWRHCHLRAVLDYASLRFFASPDGTQWQSVGPVLDATKLSDDYG